MYYLTTYWFSVRNSDSYLLRKNRWTPKPFVPLRRDYHCTNITHMNFINVIPFQPQQSLYAVFLHATAAHTHTHTCALHLPYKHCAKLVQLFPTWATIQHYPMLDARLLCSVSPREPYCCNQMPLETHTTTLLQSGLQMLFTWKQAAVITNLTLIIWLLK